MEESWWCHRLMAIVPSLHFPMGSWGSRTWKWNLKQRLIRICHPVSRHFCRARFSKRMYSLRRPTKTFIWPMKTRTWLSILIGLSKSPTEIKLPSDLLCFSVQLPAFAVPDVYNWLRCPVPNKRNRNNNSKCIFLLNESNFIPGGENIPSVGSINTDSINVI